MALMLDEWELCFYVILSFFKVIHPSTIQDLRQLNLIASMGSWLRPWIEATCSMVFLCSMGPNRLQLNYNIHMFLSRLRPNPASWLRMCCHHSRRTSTWNLVRQTMFNNACCCRNLSNNDLSGPVDFSGWIGSSRFFPDMWAPSQFRFYEYS